MSSVAVDQAVETTRRKHAEECDEVRAEIAAAEAQSAEALTAWQRASEVWWALDYSGDDPETDEERAAYAAVEKAHELADRADARARSLRGKLARLEQPAEIARRLENSRKLAERFRDR